MCSEVSSICVCVWVCVKLCTLSESIHGIMCCAANCVCLRRCFSPIIMVVGVCVRCSSSTSIKKCLLKIIYTFLCMCTALIYCARNELSLRHSVRHIIFNQGEGERGTCRRLPHGSRCSDIRKHFGRRSLQSIRRQRWWCLSTRNTAEWNLNGRWEHGMSAHPSLPQRHHGRHLVYNLSLSLFLSSFHFFFLSIDPWSTCSLSPDGLRSHVFL